MRRLRRTKIVATLGPASGNPEMIARLFEAGADVFRINMSHTPHDRMRELVGAIRQVEKDHNRPIGILVDLQGPKLRVGAFAGGSAMLDNGASFTFDADPKPGDASRVHLPHPEIFEGVQAGHTLLLDDGKIRLVATEASKQKITVRVEVGGKLSDRKGVSLPDSIIPFSALTPKDRSDLDAALDAGIDWIGLSFVQRPDDIAEAKKITRGRAAVMAKIEKPQAVARIDEIIDLTDAIMVARGDLGVEMPLEKVPGIQKQLTRAARQAGKPVVVATQMLESMITSAGADPRRSVRRRDRDLRRRRRGDAVGGVRGRAVPGRGGRDHEPHRRRGGKRRHLPHHHEGAARRARGDRRRRHRRRGAPDRRDARPLGDRLLDVFRLDRPARRARAAAAADRCDLAEPRDRPQALGRLGHPRIVAEDANDTDDMVERACRLAFTDGFAKAGRRVIIVAGVPLGTPGATNMLRIAFVGGDTASD